VSSKTCPPGVIGVVTRRGSGGHSESRAIADDFNDYFRAVFPKAVAVAQRVTRDRAAAEDAAIEALAKAHFRWHRIGRHTWRDAWVLRVAINEAIRRLPRPDAGAVVETSDLADAVALRQTLTAALLKLPRRQCEVIALRYLVGLSETEIADALQISHGSVKTHLRRGLSRLRETEGRNLKEEQLAQLA
jgi:RNA polymerase sigma factor (sigma-70 family)